MLIAAAMWTVGCAGTEDGSGADATAWLVEPVVHIDDYFGCAIDTQGNLECWATDLGEEVLLDVNEHGQLDPPEGTFEELWLGPSWGVAIDTDGALHLLLADQSAWTCPSHGYNVDVTVLDWDPAQVLSLSATDQDACATLDTNPPTLSCLYETSIPAW